MTKDEVHALAVSELVKLIGEQIEMCQVAGISLVDVLSEALMTAMRESLAGDPEALRDFNAAAEVAIPAARDAAQNVLDEVRPPPPRPFVRSAEGRSLARSRSRRHMVRRGSS